MNQYATIAATLAFSAALPAFAAPDEEALGKSKGYPVCPSSKGSLSPEYCLIGVMTHYREAYPARAVKKADAPRELKRAAAEPRFDYMGAKGNGIQAFLDNNRNTGLLIMKGDTVFAERYQYERGPESMFVSMSMSKTLVALLVGVALAEQKIKSIDDLAQQYVPELKGHPYGETPIRHLLTMSSGVKFEEVYNGHDDVMKLANSILFQEGPGGAAALLPYKERIAEPGKRWSYASSETFLLGLIVRGATGRNLSDYMSEKIWQPMGAEADAAWNIDPAGNEVGYCCFSARLRDWARLGLLLADGGARDGKQIIPADWLREMTKAQGVAGHYGYQTWVTPDGDRFKLRGLRGQAVDVHPASRTVVVHTAVYPIRGSNPQELFFDAVLKNVSGVKQ
jgi:CubicO group peptidase (beta-lactamase class C family)